MAENSSSSVASVAIVVISCLLSLLSTSFSEEAFPPKEISILTSKRRRRKCRSISDRSTCVQEYTYQADPKSRGLCEEDEGRATERNSTGRSKDQANAGADWRAARPRSATGAEKREAVSKTVQLPNKLFTSGNRCTVVPWG